jgi:hypothetical protein
LEDLSVDECPSTVSISDLEQEIETILRRCRAEHIQGVITTDDYPGTTVASVVAHELNLPSPTPEATPDFQLIYVRPEAAMPQGRSFPLFVKPVKSFFSVGAQPVEEVAEGGFEFAGVGFQHFEKRVNQKKSQPITSKKGVNPGSTHNNKVRFRG